MRLPVKNMACQKLFLLPYLANIWAIRLFSRRCDIYKDFRAEIPAIHSKNTGLSRRFKKLSKAPLSKLNA
jgi:hypothetical protein